MLNHSFNSVSQLENLLEIHYSVLPLLHDAFELDFGHGVTDPQHSISTERHLSFGLALACKLSSCFCNMCLLYFNENVWTNLSLEAKPLQPCSLMICQPSSLPATSATAIIIEPVIIADSSLRISPGWAAFQGFVACGLAGVIKNMKRYQHQ